MPTPILLLLSSLRSLIQSPLSLRLENLALHHQLNVLRRQQKGRVQLRPADRLFWAWLSKVWSNWRCALVIVKPETVIGWHRKGFRLYWRWKSRGRCAGRPIVSRAIWDLIRKMSLANPIWGAPRIHAQNSRSAGRSCTRSLARLLAPHGITVNTISPGFIDSGSAPPEELEKMVKQIPANYIGELKDVVGAVDFLLSDQARYVNGTNMHVSGGWGL